MKDLIINIFGNYTPVTYLRPFPSADGTSPEVIEIVAEGLAGVDWPWVSGVLLFGLVLWSFFRLLGVLIRG